ncbi:hypothetical protein DNTS_002519, partial [Danionella cerebrum]
GIKGRVIKLFQQHKSSSDCEDKSQSCSHRQTNNPGNTTLGTFDIQLIRPHGSAQIWLALETMVSVTVEDTSVLKRWKLNWCDLWIDGSFVFYKSESRRDYETKVNLKSSCVNVKSGLECAGVCPPESHPRENLLVVHQRDGSLLILCANSEDEALAWKLTLMEAKRNPVFTYNPYDDTYQTVPIDSHNAVYIMPGTGSGDRTGSPGRNGCGCCNAFPPVDALLVLLRNPVSVELCVMIEGNPAG